MKLLFVHIIQIGDEDQTGKTLAHIFDGIKDVTIMQYCLNPYAKDNSLFLTIKTDATESLINATVQKLINEGYGKTGTRHLRNAENEKKWKLTLKHKIYSAIRESLLFVRNISNPRISHKNYEEIRTFAPDIIYTLGGSVFTLKVVNKLAKALKTPIVVHSMDDLWHTRYTGKGWQQKALRRRLDKETIEAYSLSHCGVGISLKMAEAYSAELQIPFFHAMNCIDSLHYKPKETNYNDMLIIFSGGVHGGRDRVIRKLISDIDKFNTHSNHTTFRLEIYTNPYGCELLSGVSSPSVSVNAYVDENRMYDNLQRADILLHVESFEKTNIDYFKYSLSTKIPECLSVGRPLMVIGPNGNGTVDYIKTKNVGWVITDISDIDTVLSNMVNEDFAVYSECALQAAEEHLKNVVQQRIKDAFLFSIECNKNKFLRSGSCD